MGLTNLIERGLGLRPRPEKDQARQDAKANPAPLPETLLKAYRAGDYQNALSLCNPASTSGAELAVFRGETLMQLGQMDEAVETLTGAVAAAKDSKPAALANCVLGQVYLLQQSLDKAHECFTTALSQWPERGSTHRNLAEVWLRRGSPSEAVRWARLGVEKERVGAGVTPETKAANLATDLAVLALATAATSRDGVEVEKLAREAAGLCGGAAVTSVAQVHVYCGLAYKVIGYEVKAAEHFAVAVRVDPRGAWGREAEGFATEA